MHVIFQNMCNLTTTSKKQRIKITNFWSIYIFSKENSITCIWQADTYSQQKVQIFKEKNVDTRTISPTLRKGRKPLEIHCLQECNSAL